MRFHAPMMFVVMALVVDSSALAQSPETSLTSSEGVLLLRNGQTLEGNITRTGDHYLVTRGMTSEVRLPAASVELVCADLEALYQYKITALQRGNRASHLALARWCLQHDLAARAADQSLMAFALDPSGSGLDVIERQLLAAETSVEAATSAPENTRSVLTLREIEQTIEKLPVGTVQQFVTSVQPLLMNRCATNGCHGTRSETGFQLLRPSTRQALSRRMTQRNLITTLDFVERGNPRQSPLLTKSQSPHGGRGAVFSEAETHQMQLLAKWVAGLSGHSIADLPESVAGPPGFLLQTRPEALAEMMNSFTPAETQPNGEPPKAAVRGKLDGEYQPRDPFDPELFNRRTPNAPE